MNREIKTFEIKNNGRTKEFFVNGEKLDMTGVNKVVVEVDPNLIVMRMVKTEYFTYSKDGDNQ